MWRYRDWLPLRRDAEILSLGEGWTPLLRSRDASEFRLFFKNETANPTGSHKDRNLSVGISKAVEFGFDTVLLYSDGSTSPSSAAYAARAGLRHITVVPRDTPEYRLLPLSIYNSVIVQHQGRARTLSSGPTWLVRGSAFVRPRRSPREPLRLGSSQDHRLRNLGPVG